MARNVCGYQRIQCVLRCLFSKQLQEPCKPSDKCIPLIIQYRMIEFIKFKNLILTAKVFNCRKTVLPNFKKVNEVIKVCLRLNIYTKINFNDFTETVPCFILVATMPFTSSISEGIVLGLISYVAIKVCTFRYKEVSLTMYILAVFFLLKYII